jgi:hypothetical protein
MSVPLGCIKLSTIYLFHYQYLPQEPQVRTIYNKTESSSMLNKINLLTQLINVSEQKGASTVTPGSNTKNMIEVKESFL